METMKAMRIHGYGGPDVMSIDEVPRPEPGPGQVLIRVRAASVNPVDWKIREGYLRQFMDPPLPMGLGSDMAGDVAAVGPDVTQFKVGDPVYGMAGFSFGTHAEYVALPAAQLAPKPASMDYITAAAIPHAASTAWQALTEVAKVQEGQKVLIHAASGGVGSYAVQFAKLLGAHVIATTSTANMDMVRDLGADEVIDYKTTSFDDVVSNVDAVIDTIGGDTQERCWGIVKPTGVVATLVGFSPASTQMAQACGARAEMVQGHPDPVQLQKIGDWVEAGKVRPIISKVLPFSEIRQAYDLSQTGHARGKIVMNMDGD